MMREMVRAIRMASGVTALLFVVGVAASDTSAQGKGDPEAGKTIYASRCAVCHGVSGGGDGPAAQALSERPSNWKADGGGLKGLGDQQIFELIAKGGKVLGKSPVMPAHPDLSEADLWNLVAYAKSLMKGEGGGPMQEVVPSPKRALPEGEALRWGSALDWAITLTIGLSVLILICILVSLIVYRGRQTEGSALWLHLLSLGISPLFLLAVGNFAVIEYAKEVRFCGACHLTMKPYIDDLHSTKGKSLAALHFQHRSAPNTECYSCHANYGVHGTFEAKMTGLRDVYRYVTRTYQLPLNMREPFENTLCLKCHNGAKRYMALEIHLKLSEAMRAGQIKCVGCHRPSHDVPKPTQALGQGGVG